MDWIAQIEKRKFLMVGGILLVAIGALIISAFHAPITPDTFWHLQMGKDWLVNDLSPFTDHYSYTYNGSKITGPPVVFQSLLYLSVSQFGLLTGLHIFRLLSFLLTLGAVVLLLRQMKARAILYAIVIPLIVFLLQLRAVVRPEMLSYAFSVIALLLYFRAEKRISSRNLLPMVVLMLVWGNYHSPIFGYVIFFGFFLDCAIAQFEIRSPALVWLKWFGWGMAILAVGFLNPEFSHPVIQSGTFSSEWKILINEYLPPAPFLKSVPGFYVLILTFVLALVLAYRQRQFGLLVVCLVFIYSATMMQRMVTPSGIIIVMVTAQLLSVGHFFNRSGMGRDSNWSKFVGPVLLMLIAVTIYSNIERSRLSFDEGQSVLSRYPVAMADYMKEKSMSGRIFNDYGIGGYLIYRLAPQSQVYIDGRTGILYPLEHLKRYREVTGNNREVLRTELDKLSVDYIIWGYNQGRHDLIQEMGGFGLDFLGPGYVLYTRGLANFSLHGKLLSQPQCWRPDMQNVLNDERRKMDEILPDNSGLIRFSDLVVGYSNAEDGKAFFDTSIEGKEWFDSMRRFAGYRFLETEHYDLVSILLGGVETRKPKDYLVSALAKIKAGDYEVAAQIIGEYSNTRWPRILPEDVFIHYQLYRLLEEQRDLMAVEEKHVEALQAQLMALDYSDLDSGIELDARSFCTLFGGGGNL